MIIAFGIRGAFGLLNLTLGLLLPPTVFALFRYPAKLWLHPKVAPAAALATCLVLFMLDSVINNMYNPIFPLISGGLSGLCLHPPESLKVQSSERKPSVAVKKSVLKKPVPKKLQQGKSKQTSGKTKNQKRRVKLHHKRSY